MIEDIRFQFYHNAIDRKRSEIQDRCSICNKSTQLCDTCDKEFRFWREIIKANLPLAKVNFIIPRLNYETKERLNDVDVSEYLIDADKPTGAIPFYKNFLNPYIDNFARALEDGYSFMMCGPNGAGKTAGATYLAMKLIEASYRTFYITFPGLHQLHQTSFDRESENERALIKELMVIDLLIVDELGKEIQKSKMVERLADTYLKAREESLKPTVIITNLSARDLKTNSDGYGPSFWSMLGERYKIFTFPKIDLRLQNRKKWNI